MTLGYSSNDIQQASYDVRRECQPDQSHLLDFQPCLQVHTTTTHMDWPNNCGIGQITAGYEGIPRNGYVHVDLSRLLLDPVSIPRTRGIAIYLLRT